MAEAKSYGTNALFRAETAITSMDYRLDVAQKIEKFAESEDIEIEDRVEKYHWDLNCIRGSRNVEIEGNYNRDTQRGEIILLTNGAIRERVYGPVYQQMSLEAEAIMGGGFISVNVAPYLKLAAVGDHLAWGGWAEADAIRVEIAAFAFRVYFGYQHNMVARILSGNIYIDEFLVRTETFGAMSDLQEIAVYAGTPGSGVIAET